MESKVSEIPKNIIENEKPLLSDINDLEKIKNIDSKKSLSKNSKSFVKESNNNLINDEVEKISKSQSVKNLTKNNDFNAIELSFVRKDYNGIEINKSNKNKIHISFCDMFKKPLADIIDVESYKKMNYLIYVGFAENEFGEECDVKNENIDCNNNLNTLIERRKQQSEMEAKDGKEAICSTCNVF